MNSYDWLKDMENPSFYPTFNIIEVRFKGGRKEFFKNSDTLELVIGDSVVVENQQNKHLGYVSLTGELVKLQMRKKGIEDNQELNKIIRKATPKDIEDIERTREKEGTSIYRAREIIRELNLKMKLSDVEFQMDGKKALFYYSADDRVDFRELIKKLAEEFKVRVEMKQISLRHEAARLGGIGSCGRELCCSTWLTDFKSVTTQAARYQNLSINPQKLSGQCGRLKCCLNYELDTYKNAVEDIPNIKKPLITTAGKAYLQKTDIFKRIMWFSIDNDTDWKPIDVEEVKKIVTLNEKGEKGEFEIKEIPIKSSTITDETINLEGSLNRMDNKPKKKNKKRNRNNKNYKKRNNNAKK